jgi:hypothetical protein
MSAEHFTSSMYADEAYDAEPDYIGNESGWAVDTESYLRGAPLGLTESAPSGGYNDMIDPRLIEAQRATAQQAAGEANTLEAEARKTEWLYRKAGVLGVMTMTAFQQPESAIHRKPDVQLGMAMSAANYYSEGSGSGASAEGE